MSKAGHDSSFSEDVSSSFEQSNLLSNPLFSVYGSVFKVCSSNSRISPLNYFMFQSSKPISLTEAETEYKVNLSNIKFISTHVLSQVTCIVHLFQSHVVFEFKCTNTIEEQVLEDISVSMEMIEGVDFLAENSTISLDRMPLGDEGSTFVIFDRKEVKQRFLVLKKFFNFFL